jgi:hypothetical protein
MAKLDKHVTEMNVFFEQVDKNGDGEITRQEMKVGLEALRDHPKGNHAVFAAPLLTEPEIEVVLDGLFKFHDNVRRETLNPNQHDRLETTTILLYFTILPFAPTHTYTHTTRITVSTPPSPPSRRLPSDPRARCY